MIKIKRWILAAVLLAAPALAAEEPAEPPITPIDSRYDCRRDEATPVAFLELAKNMEAYVGKCVIVRGLTEGYFLYGGIEDYYQFNNRALENRRPYVGLYAPNDEARKQLFGWRQTVELVAFANTCNHLRAYVHKDDYRKATRTGQVDSVRIHFLTGYCHYTTDPVLHVSEFRVIDAGPVHLIGDEARRVHGDLNDLLPTSPIFAQASSRIRQWFDAVRRRDMVSLFNQSWHGSSAKLGDKDEWPNSIFWDKDSPLRFLFGRQSLPPIKYYVIRISASEAEKGDYLVSGCICRTADCSGRWSIHSADVGIVTPGPYVCMWVHRTGGDVRVGD